MRINPLGTFREVQRLIDLPSASSATRGEEFASTLASIAPNQLKSRGNEAIRQNSGEPMEEPRARINIPGPELLFPSLQPALVPEVMDPDAPSPVQETQPEPAPSVKTPTVVSAKRIGISDPFDGMSRAEREEAVARLVQAAGSRHGIDPALSMAVVATESSFNARAVSTDGHSSKGLMQLLDSTGREQHSEADLSSEYAPFHPPLNVDLGVRYLRQLHDMFGIATKISTDLSTTPAANSTSLEKLAVAAYNAGQGRVAAAQQRAERAGKDPSQYTSVESYLPQTTQEYVKRVMQQRERFETRFVAHAEEK